MNKRLIASSFTASLSRFDVARSDVDIPAQDDDKGSGRLRKPPPWTRSVLTDKGWQKA